MSTMITLLTIALTTVLAQSPAHMQAQAPEDLDELPPTPVAERYVTVGETCNRVSLFSSRVAVVSVSEAQTQVSLRRLSLTEEQYLGFLVAIRDSVGRYNPELLRSLGQQPDLERTPMQAQLRIYDEQPPDRPLQIHYSPVANTDLATSQLVAIFDDLESMVSAVGPYHEQLQRWQPSIGDRVELLNGRSALVSDVSFDLDGEPLVIVLEHEDSPMVDVVAVTEIPQVVFRVLSEIP